MMNASLALLSLLLLLVVAANGFSFSPSRQAFVWRGGASDNSTDTPQKNKSRKKRAANKKKAKKKASNPTIDEVLGEEDFYRVLGTTKEKVQKSSNPDREVQKAYRKRAVHTHPDKTGGDREAFDKVAEAYEGLQDDEKRKIYDRYGKDGAKQFQQQGAAGGATGMGASSPEELFRRFFGGRNPFDSFGQQQQAGPTVYIYDVSLEALYHGLTRQVRLPDGGSIVVSVPPGAHDGDVITEKLDDGTEVCFRLRVAQHIYFVRKGPDLAVELRISLSESLTGLQRKIKHLDGRTLHVVSAKDGTEVNNPAPIRTGDVHVLKGQGMPKDASASSYGDLYVQYEVVNPRVVNPLTEEERRELKRLLNKVEGKEPKSSEWPFVDVESTNILKKSSPSAFGAGFRKQQSPFSESFNPFGGNGFFFSSQSQGW